MTKLNHAIYKMNGSKTSKVSFFQENWTGKAVQGSLQWSWSHDLILQCCWECFVGFQCILHIQIRLFHFEQHNRHEVTSLKWLLVMGDGQLIPMSIACLNVLGNHQKLLMLSARLVIWTKDTQSPFGGSALLSSGKLRLCKEIVHHCL